MTLLARFIGWIDRQGRSTADCIGCGHKAAVEQLPMVMGPRFGICRRCHTEALPLAGRTGPGAAYPDNDHLTHCHFCGTKRDAAPGLVGWPRGAICRDCLKLSTEIFSAGPPLTEPAVN
jgi:hypothetical protein